MARRSNLENRASRKILRAREEYWRAVDDADLQWLMSDIRGRRFLERRLFYALTTFPAAIDNSHLTVNLGQRKAALELWNDAQRVSPEPFTLLLAEKAQRMIEEAMVQANADAAPVPPDETQGPADSSQPTSPKAEDDTE